MIEPSLFGISKAEWDLVNGFANWFSAIGSFAAAAAALHIAKRSSRPTATVTVGHRVLIVQGEQNAPEFLEFRIVNTGDRPIRITGIGWKMGIRRKKFAMQMYDEAMSSPLPIDLTHSQVASWYVPLNIRSESWCDRFAKGMLMPHYRSAIWSMRAQFHSSVGFVFECRPESNLRRMLEDVAKSVRYES